MRFTLKQLLALVLVLCVIFAIAPRLWRREDVRDIRWNAFWAAPPTQSVVERLTNDLAAEDLAATTSIPKLLLPPRSYVRDRDKVWCFEGHTKEGARFYVVIAAYGSIEPGCLWICIGYEGNPAGSSATRKRNKEKLERIKKIVKADIPGS